jgi:hypothetical protein
MESEVVIKEHLNNALNTFSQGEYLDDMLEAKKVYFEVTGIANEEDDDYESRMNSFNDWYVLQFQSSRSARTVIKEYFIQNQVEEEVKDSLLNFSFSYYEFVGRSFRKHIVLKDILHDKKILLPKDHYELGMVKNDTFVGRLITHQDQSFLLDGVCVMPKEVSSLLKKEAKKVRKMNKEEEEIHFLMQLEYLKNKWQRYLHIDPLKIFVFD